MGLGQPAVAYGEWWLFLAAIVLFAAGVEIGYWKGERAGRMLQTIIAVLLIVLLVIVIASLV